MRSWLSIITLLALSGTALSGCGIKGGLDTPPPLWGGEDKEASVQDDEAVAETTEDATEDGLEEDELGYGVDVAD